MGCIRAATQDEGFLRLPSTEARTAHFTACGVLKWAVSNIREIQQCAETLVEEINNCFKKPPTSKVLREKVWTSLFSYVTSEHYKSTWSHLIEQINIQDLHPSPILYFFVIHRLFCVLLKKQYPPRPDGNDILPNCSSTLSADEEGALRYVGGYMIRSVIKKLKQRAHHSKRK